MLDRRQFGLMTLAGTLAAPALLRASRATAQAPARNAILMVSDGAGFHSWAAASLFRHGRLGQEVYDRFPVRTLMTTFPLNTGTRPGGSGMPTVGYDAARAWSAAPGAGDTGGAITKRRYPNHFAGYGYVKQDYVDSAAAGTALSAGIKTYNSAINWTDADQPARHLGDRVKAAGKALGVVSSVQISHATPAAFYAHNASRTRHAAIAEELLSTGLCDVAMGAGHPFFDNDGQPRTPPDDRAFRFVGGPDLFERLRRGRTPYQLIDNRLDFDLLALGRLRFGKDRLLGLAPVASTLQFSRGQGTAPGDALPMGGLIGTVPTLETMTRGALAFLGDKPDGFFLMVEGGAVDWAAHANNTARLIEEQIAFNRAVEAAVAWIEANGGFEQTLLIVTTDHGNGMVYGPDSDRYAFQPVVHRGPGILPDVRWHYDTHTNELVPVWANGPGAGALVAASIGEDPHTGLVGWGEVTRYHDNTDIAATIAASLGLG